MRLARKINQEKQTNKQQQQQQQKQKQAKKQQKTATATKQPTRFFRFFTSSLPVSISKICLLSAIRIYCGMMLFIMSYFFVKATVFIELVKAISFSILFTFLDFRYKVI